MDTKPSPRLVLVRCSAPTADEPVSRRCPEHFTGASLGYVEPVRLRVVTRGPEPVDPCIGTMTCPCERCRRERTSRAAHGGGHQPWMPRPARRRAA